MVALDACSVLNCGVSHAPWTFHQKYICLTGSSCPWRKMTDKKEGRYEASSCGCSRWDYVLANTGSDWGYGNGSPMKHRLSIISQNPSAKCETTGRCNPVIIMLKEPRSSDTGVYVMGIHAPNGKDPLQRFAINVSPSNVAKVPSSDEVSAVVIEERFQSV